MNSKALEVSGITRDTPDPPAGTIVKDPKTGEPTGLLRNAYSVLKGLPGDAYGGSKAQETDLVKSLFRRYNARGLTSVADRSASGTVSLRLYFNSCCSMICVTVRSISHRVTRPDR